MKTSKASKTSFERYLSDNPPLMDVRYIKYVNAGGSCWGHYFREHYAKEFNKQYETVWLQRPDLWDCEDER